MNWMPCAPNLSARRRRAAPLYDAKVDELRRTFPIEKALKTGDHAPDFTLPNPSGRAVSLSALLRSGPAVVTFYRGGWCPYCNLQLRAYQQALGEITALVAISPQLPDGSMSTAETRAEGIIVDSDYATARNKTRIVEFAAQNRLPAIYVWSVFVRAGGLLSYGPSFYELFRHTATYVDRILKGTKPADLPVEQPTRYELVVNLKTAKALGLTIPQSILARADEVIE